MANDASNSTVPPPAPPPMGKGWVEEPYDQRDKYYAPRSAVNPDAFSGQDLRTHKVYGQYWPQWFYDQGEWGTCVANAVGMAFLYELNKEGKTKFNPSRLFIYFNARKLTYQTWSDRTQNPNSKNPDEGTVNRMALKSLDKFGVAHEDTWDYLWRNFGTDPTTSVSTEGLLSRAMRYERLDSAVRDDSSSGLSQAQKDAVGAETLLRLRQCISEGYPVVFGFHPYVEDFDDIWVDPKAGDGYNGITHVIDLPPVNQRTRTYGGHAVLAVGFDDSKKRILCQNSWGGNWPYAKAAEKKGIFYMPYSWIEDYSATSDFWMLRLLEAQASPATSGSSTIKPNPTPIQPRRIIARFTDDQTGAGCRRYLYDQAQDHKVADLMVAGTKPVTFITSIELQTDFQNIALVVKNDGQVIGQADGNRNNVARIARTPVENLVINVNASN